MSKKILIVGGTGFLGYHLAKKCRKKNWKVTSISSSKPKKKRYLKNIDYIIADITNREQLKKKLIKKFDYIVNFGGYVDHTNKAKTFKSHFYGCKNLVDFFLKKKIKLFLQIGSCVEYGKAPSPQKEIYITDVNKVNSKYGKAKLLATNYLLEKNKQYKFPCTILRPYLVYGPKQDFNRFIPITIKGCFLNSKFPSSSGKQFRDFLYIDDFINAVFKCLKSNKVMGEIFNVGSAKPQKIKNVIKIIKNIIKSGRPDFGKINMRKDEILKLYPDIEKIKTILNWYPKENFQNGLKKTIRYYGKNI